MSKPTAQQCHALTTYFAKVYTEKVGKPAVFNRNKARWSWDSVLMDYTPGQVREMLDFYVEHWTEPNLEWFFYNCEKVDLAIADHNQEEEARHARRALTQQRLDEWRNRWKK
jgi:hypothetical protein